MDISIDFYQANPFTSPCSGSVSAPSSSHREQWLHRDLSHHTACLQARVPRLACCRRVSDIERP